MIFKEFEEKPYGSYKMETLEDMWLKREEIFNQKLRQLIEETNKEKS